jgi:hypothetical protein
MAYYRPVLSLIEKAAQAGLLDVAKAVIERSNELSPKDTLETIDSAFARVDDLTAQAGYGSFVARLQHENLEYEHLRGGGPKFLETAADEIRPQVAAIIAKRVQGELGG